MREIGRQLGIRYALEGSIQKSGKRVRITGQLIGARDGAHIWAERYDRELADIFDLQDDITRSVVSAIEPNLLSVEIARARVKPTKSLVAYDFYLRSLPELHSGTEAGLRKAEGLLAEAVRRDPHFSEAWAASAECALGMAIRGWIADWDAASNRGSDAARKAIEADPQNGASLGTAAYVLAVLGGKLDEAMELPENALRLHPNSSSVCMTCGWVFVYNGAYERAISLLESAHRMSPLDPLGYRAADALAMAYLLSERWDEAQTWNNWALSRWPSNAISLRIRAAILASLGRMEEARRAVSALLGATKRIVRSLAASSVP